MSERCTCHHPRMVPTGGQHAAPDARPAAGGRWPRCSRSARRWPPIALRIVDPVPIVPSTFGFADLSLVSFGVLGITFASVGALFVVRLPRNAVGWCMVVVGASYALAALAAAATFSAVADGPSGIDERRAGGLVRRPVLDGRLRHLRARLHLPDGPRADAGLGSLHRRRGHRAADRDRRRLPDQAGTAADLPDHRQSVRVRPGPAADLRQAAVADDRGSVVPASAPVVVWSMVVRSAAVRRGRPPAAQVVRGQPRRGRRRAGARRPWGPS